MALNRHAMASQPLTPESQAVYEKQVVPFLRQHCWKCHDEKSARAGFQVDTLGTDFLAGKTANHWREAIDMINLGKMPPRKKPRPDPAAAFAVVEWVNAEMRNAEKRARLGTGQVPMRRLNRTEYANTVRDLFHLDEEFARKLEQELPPDGKVDGFDRGGAALYIDRSQLQTYLEAARTVVDEALPTEKVKESRYRHEAIKDQNLVRPPRPTITMKEVLDRAQQLTNVYSKGPVPEFKPIPRGPELSDFYQVRDKGVETWLGADFTGNWLAYLQRDDMARQVVTRDGWYRVRLRAGADRGSGELAVDAVRISVQYCPDARDFAARFAFTIDAPLHQPKVYEKLIYLRAGGPSLEKSIHFTWNIHYPAEGHRSPVLEDRRLSELMRAALQDGEAYEQAKVQKKPAKVIEAARIQRDATYEKIRTFAREFQGPVYHLDPRIDLSALPRLWHEFVELEGPVTLEWPTRAMKEVFFDGETREDDTYLREIFTRLLPRAYRRPVTPDEIAAQVQLVHTMRDKHGKSFGEAVRAAVRSILTSSEFLFLEEPTEPAPGSRAITDAALACRLSYFLWSSMPDAELFELAAQQRLHEPAVLASQARRLLRDPKARQFVENFVGQWMRARDFGSVIVDQAQYRQYDEALKAAELREPYEFFAELLHKDLPITNLLDSDFVMVNERLARHYGIEGIRGEELRRVPLKPKHHRGGILGMAGLLTYLSDGSRTQPVKRGAYVLDVLWNRRAPLPPPNVGDLPVVKDRSLTVRQRLEQHRSVASCASCHARIDPLGLALENYDAIGAWRERQNGEGHRGDEHDPLIDSSGVMPDGEPFRTPADFKRVLLDQKAKLLKGFTEKLLTYALGRPVGAVDREIVDSILAESAKQDHRLQALLGAMVASPAFRNK